MVLLPVSNRWQCMERLSDVWGWACRLIKQEWRCMQCQPTCALCIGLSKIGSGADFILCATKLDLGDASAPEARPHPLCNCNSQLQSYVWNTQRYPGIRITHRFVTVPVVLLSSPPFLSLSPFLSLLCRIRGEALIRAIAKRCPWRWVLIWKWVEMYLQTINRPASLIQI